MSQPTDATPGPTAGRTLAVLLAAGAGSRFGGTTHKLAARLDGEAVLTHAIRAALTADIGPVVVVTGAHEPALDAFSDAVAAGRLTTLPNPNWAEGQSTSLTAAVEHADAVGADVVVVGLGDQPFVTPEAWRRVAAADAPIAAADYGHGPRNPVRLARSIWPLLPRSGDRGAGPLISLRPDLVERVPCDGSPSDIDTLEDLHSWQKRSSTNSR